MAVSIQHATKYTNSIYEVAARALSGSGVASGTSRRGLGIFSTPSRRM